MGKRSFLDPKVIVKLSRFQLCSKGLVIGSFSGLHKSPHKGASVEFAQYREYVKGDDIRYVDWRVWARTDRFFLKEFEAETNLRCYILIDRSSSMGFGSPVKKIEFAIRLASTFAHIAIRQGDAVGLFLFSDSVDLEIPPRHNPAHLVNIYNALENTTVSGKTDISSVLHKIAEKINKRAMVIVISDLFDNPATLLPSFCHFCHKKHDLIVFHLIDPQEIDFPFKEPTCFIDLEKSQHVITDPSILKYEYKKNFGNYLEKN